MLPPSERRRQAFGRQPAVAVASREEAARAVEVALGVAALRRALARCTAARLPAVAAVVAIDRPEALDRRPRLDQRAVDREVLARQQPLHLRQRQQRGQEPVGDVAGQQPVAVLAEHRGVPYRIVDAEPDEPAVQQIELQFGHQPALRADREERLQQCRPQQHLGRNGGPPHRRIQFLEPSVQRTQRRVHDLPDRPQWMVGRNPLLKPHVREQALRPIIAPTHAKSPRSSRCHGITINACRRDSFSAAC